MEAFNAYWIDALGWTLLHSIWQSLIIWTLFTLLIKVIRIEFAALRYIGWWLALATQIALSVYTYIAYLPASVDGENVPLVFSLPSEVPQVSVRSFATTIDQYISTLVMAWSIGMLWYCIRLGYGLFQLDRLRKRAHPADIAYQQMVLKWRTVLHITRKVEVLISPQITAPCTIGVIKPVILLPLQMISGLTQEQLELIFIHELYHIKRHDYLFNVVQLIAEAVFFFNPFLRMISQNIRREREYCCDDAAANVASPQVYAATLARVEEFRTTQQLLTMSIKGSENELLTRIKRIMKSPHQSIYRGSIVPAALLIVATLCMAWMNLKKESTIQTSELQAADTTIKQQPKTAVYSRKSITTIGPDGKPNEEVVENFEGDESLREVMRIPPVPPMPAPHDQDVMQYFHYDTIPGNPFAPLPPDWKSFDSDFGRAFQDQFKSFFEQDALLQNMMQDFHLKFDEQWEQNLRNKIDSLDVWQKQFSWEDMEERMEAVHEQLRGLDHQFLFAPEPNTSAGHRLTEELIADGYLKTGEQINSLSWEEGGNISVNKKKIKETHVFKYRELLEDYFKR